MSNQSFTVSQGSYRDLQYCDGQSCSSRIDFDYNLDPDRNDCNPYKCNASMEHELINFLHSPAAAPKVTVDYTVK